MDCPLKDGISESDSAGLDPELTRRLPFFGGLHLAVSFLTRLPLPPPRCLEEGALARAMHLFPLAGLMVGAIGALVFALAALVLPQTLAAILAVAATLLATGAMHEDGLTDIADGFGGGKDRDGKLAIMKDSRIGSYGTATLIVALALRTGALAVMPGPARAAAALLAAHALARTAIPLVMQRLPPARPGGLGAAVGQPSPSTAGIAVTLGLAVAASVLPAGAALAAALAALAAAFAVAVLAWRQIGGQTGDVLGAVEQVVEVAVLLAVAAFP
jgi:adenosylcobinamide-GDP ribazoletransferase